MCVCVCVYIRFLPVRVFVCVRVHARAFIGTKFGDISRVYESETGSFVEILYCITLRQVGVSVFIQTCILVHVHAFFLGVHLGTLMSTTARSESIPASVVVVL